MESLVPKLHHGETNLEALSEPLVFPSNGGKHPPGPLAPPLTVDEGVTVRSGSKDDPRSRKVPKLSKAQQAKGVRDLSAEVEELKQEL